MASLLSWLKRKAEAVGHDIGEAIHGDPTPQPQRPTIRQFSPKAQAVIRARNPQQADRIIAAGHDISSGPAVHFNPLQAAQQSFRAAIPKVATGTGLATGRVAGGIAQDVSGLVDLATPGTGNSRVTQGLQRFNSNLDTTAKRLDVNPAYRIMQVPATAASFLGPGEIVKGIQGVNKLAQAPRFINSAANALERTNGAGRITAAGLRNGVSGAAVANTAVGTLGSIGNESSKGQQITRGSVARDIGLNAAGNFVFPMAGQAGLEAAKGVRAGAQATNAARRAAVNTQRELDNYNAQVRDLQRQKQAIQGRMNALPATPQNARAVNELLRKQDMVDAQLASLTKPAPRNVVQKVTDRIFTAQPGLSMKAVNPDNVSKDPLAALKQKRIAELQTIVNNPSSKSITAGAYSAARRELYALKQGKNVTNPAPVGKIDLYNQAHAEAKASAPKATPAPVSHPTYGTLEDFKNKYSVGLGEVNRLKKDANGTEFWGKDQQLSRQVKGKGIYNTEDLYKHLTGAEAGAAPKATVPTTPKIDKSLPPELPTELPVERKAPNKQPTKTEFADEGKLNTNRLDLQGNEKQFLSDETTQVVDRLTNEEVQQMAKAAGIDTRSHTTEQTKQLIAKQLNTRRDAVRYMTQARNTTDLNERAALLKKAAERGRTSREQGTDLARQLQARRIIANELDTPEQRVFKLLDNAGVNPDVYAKRFAEVDFSNPQQVVAAYRDLVPAKSTQWLDTVRYNSMLSSPLTQAVNIFGNAQNVALVAPIEKTLRGGVDAARSLVTGKPRQFAAGEGTAYAKAVATNLGNASRNFADALHGRGKYANPDLEEYSIPLATKGAKGAAYKTLSFPMRVLDGFDKFFRTLAEEGEGAALELRDRKGIAIRGSRGALKEAEANYRVFQTPLGEPGQGVINDALDSFASLAMKGRSSKNPIVSTVSKFTIPFVKTVNNIAKQGVVDFSPLGYANMKGNVDKVTAFTRASMGTAVFGTSAALLASGNMTWAEPRNAEERARFRAEGKQPYAIKIGNHWYNFSKLTPAVGFPMALTAALDDAMKNKKIDQSTTDAVLEAVSKYGNFLSDQSYAKSVGDMLGAIGGDKEAVAQAVSNNIQQVVPFRALTGWIARLSDGSERKVDTSQGYIDQQVQSLMQQYPGLRQKTPTRDYKGSPIAANNQVLNGFSPIRVTSDRGVNPLDAEQDRLANALPENFKLDKRQQTALDKVVNPEVAKAQQTLIKSPEYKALSPDKQQAALDKQKKDITAARKAEYMANNQLGQYAPDYKGKTSKLTADQQAILGGSNYNAITGSSISNKLPKPQKDFLTKYNAMSSDDRQKAAYSQNDFDYKYLVAKYANDKANGKLSKAEDIRSRNAIDKAKIGKDFSKDVRDLYSVNKGDLYAFLTSDPNGQKYADDLKAYDQALYNAGLVSSLKFRNGFATASRGGSGGRRSGGSSAATKASLSATLAAAKATSGVQVPKTAAKAPSFAVRAGQTPAGYKKASLKQYAVKKPKVSLRQLAKIG